MRWLFVLFAATAATPAHAQELSVFAMTTTPTNSESWLAGSGGALSVYVRLGAVFHPDQALSRSTWRAGLRLAHSGESTMESTAPWFTGCSVDVFCPSSGERTRVTRVTRQLTFQLVPHVSRTWRLEFGGGLGRLRYRADYDEAKLGLIGNMEAARRIISTPVPLWIAAGYERHLRLSAVIADGSSWPKHHFRLGLSARAPAN